MDYKKREGGFYASKVRLFLNEYSGISLEEFCKAERVSYSKMSNCLGRTTYKKSELRRTDHEEVRHTPSAIVPVMELKPLVIDMPGTASQTVFANIRNHKLDPMTYLCDVFRRIGNTAKEFMVYLLPHKWTPLTC